MQIFTLRDLLRAPSSVLEAAKYGTVIITSRRHGQFTIKPTQVEIEITKTIKSNKE